MNYLANATKNEARDPKIAGSNGSDGSNTAGAPETPQMTPAAQLMSGLAAVARAWHKEGKPSGELATLTKRGDESNKTGGGDGGGGDGAGNGTGEGRA